MHNNSTLKTKVSPTLYLKTAGYFSFLVAILHVFLAFCITNKTIMELFGAPEFVLNAKNLPLLIILTLFLAVIFFIFGFYAFSGAGSIRRLPFLLTGLIVIGSIYTLRGLGIIVDIIAILKQSDFQILYLRLPLFSLFSLTIGLLYLIGTIRLFYIIKKQKI